jgi:hypothetical protein
MRDRAHTGTRRLRTSSSALVCIVDAIIKHLHTSLINLKAKLLSSALDKQQGHCQY